MSDEPRAENTASATSNHPSSAAKTIIRLESVHKNFGKAIAVNKLNLDIRHGEFFTMLGPSGSGKTTTLRMIAGFEKPSHGRIALDGEDITRTPPFARDINTVFQDYALFPHMTVEKNLAYGLEAKRIPKSETAERIATALKMVDLERYAKSAPGQLSGGQRQRVALARAIVNRPRVLLLDEPLGALDLKLRKRMQIELKHIQEELEITFIYVTHDQEEALVMSDRIAVFNQGRIEQLGSATDLYERPANEFVANFLGTSNIIDLNGVRVMIRPEKIQLLAEDDAPAGDDWQIQPGVVEEREFLGPFIRHQVRLHSSGEQLFVFEQNAAGFAESAPIERGAHVQVAWRHGSVYEIPTANK